MSKICQGKHGLIWPDAGVALPIVLIFVLVMALLGTAMMRNVTLEEKMAGNTLNYQRAFQAADQALRYCESQLQLSPVPETFLQLPPGPIQEGQHQDQNYWEIAANWESNAMSSAVPTTIVAHLGLTHAPRCMIEKWMLTADDEFNLQPMQAYPVFRVTARSVIAGSVVLLQSYLRP